MKEVGKQQKQDGGDGTKQRRKTTTPTTWNYVRHDKYGIALDCLFTCLPTTSTKRTDTWNICICMIQSFVAQQSHPFWFTLVKLFLVVENQYAGGGGQRRSKILPDVGGDWKPLWYFVIRYRLSARKGEDLPRVAATTCSSSRASPMAMAGAGLSFTPVTMGQEDWECSMDRLQWLCRGNKWFYYRCCCGREWQQQQKQMGVMERNDNMELCVACHDIQITYIYKGEYFAPVLKRQEGGDRTVVALLLLLYLLCDIGWRK
eukprot:scaffold34720_cov251-Amphora_coffeaeformis.AAC.2